MEVTAGFVVEGGGATFLRERERERGGEKGRKSAVVVWCCVGWGWGYDGGWAKKATSEQPRHHLTPPPTE
ncbi:unnamed protein product [Prunus armeniaca]|uniref:Uncharacterized protein n=1 Tax=Prunus armeniaca TaxID=36596 RepID=A0A6J5XYA5_PRUAR|nr:unnamed protein product [Prunus armeniaca]